LIGPAVLVQPPNRGMLLATGAMVCWLCVGFETLSGCDVAAMYVALAPVAHLLVKAV